jgi:hypothetical protein
MADKRCARNDCSDRCVINLAVAMTRHELRHSKLREGGGPQRVPSNRDRHRTSARSAEGLMINIMTTGHAAHSDETNELGRWRGPIEG